MPLIETRGAASAQGFGEFAQSGPVNYIEDVFSTYLYTGNSTSGGTQTITNNIDLSTKGGLVWIKGRSAASNHILTDTVRGVGASATDNNALASNLTSAQDLGGSSYDFLSAFSTTGFTVKQGGTTTATRGTNYNAVTYASWTFREQAKFFDVVTYTGDGANNRQISHSLGSAPGFIIVKNVTNAQSWVCYHRSSGTGNYIFLNNTSASSADANAFPTVTSTYFVPTADQTAFALNTNGDTFVAYLFAHDAGGFGLSGSDNVISCGSYTGDGASTGVGQGFQITLGYEPQFVIIKRASGGSGSWWIADNMRGLFGNGANGKAVQADASAAEQTYGVVTPNATGFTIDQSDSGINALGSTYIYIAIRRGPMKVPTSGTSVFEPIARTGTGAAATVSSSLSYADLAIVRDRTATNKENKFTDRLRGGTLALASDSTASEGTDTGGVTFDVQNAIKLGTGASYNVSGTTYINYLFRRAPGFFDIVCYTGTGANTTQTHNLGVAPELMIVKRRDATGAWDTYSAALSNTEYLVVNTTAAKATGTTRWNSTTPTSTVFSLGTSTTVNASGGTYVAYLFATLAGVSKVGSYTGTGTTLQIDCGFTGGARFVVIKRTDSTGDWYYYDSARGIVAGNDPYLFFNSQAAEDTTTDYVDTYSAGFELSSTAPAGLNANGGTYIFLAIA